MNTIFKIISFPITLIISILCMLVVVLFRWDIIKDTIDKNTGIQVAVLRIQIESRNLALHEVWEENLTLRAFLSVMIYWMIIH